MGERFDPLNVVERDRFGGGRVMIRGGISHTETTAMCTVVGNLTAVSYRDEIVRPIILSYLQQGYCDVLQQDNTRPHTARVTMNFMRQKNVPSLD